MKQYILTAVTITALLFISSFSYGQCCGKSSQGGQNKKTCKSDSATSNTGIVTETAKYSCSMHPEAVSDKPDECSKCGMALSEKKKKKKERHKECCGNKH
ncbi:MAG: hypothetical protein EPN85_00435 [Bacteroidetes bacterium]|nr:MAG: hypothetical protein EPN85_00435 [Bacteroidota bacterium]